MNSILISTIIFLLLSICIKEQFTLVKFTLLTRTHNRNTHTHTHSRVRYEKGHMIYVRLYELFFTQALATACRDSVFSVCDSCHSPANSNYIKMRTRQLHLEACHFHEKCSLLNLPRNTSNSLRSEC